MTAAPADGSEVSARRFRAEELCADGTLAAVELGFLSVPPASGSEGAGFAVERNGVAHLSLGDGYRVLRTVRCGVCSTDLDRVFLPFPLPQVVGHELIACDAAGARFVVEINASHAARGTRERCAFCRAGLASHCPDRLVLGIHDLPGGFGPFVLAPRGAVLAVPDSVPDDAAVLVEPFAAALHAVDRIAPRDGDHVAVLGTRRLGLLVVAALAARRRERGGRYRIEAWSRHPALRARALALGADVAGPPPAAADGPHADVVVDTTGSQGGLPLALALARREVHLKSTHGQPSAGIRHTTALVVDELSLERLPDHGESEAGWRDALARGGAAPGSRALVAWLAEAEPPRALARAAELVRGEDARALLAPLERRGDRLPRADVAVVDRALRIDAAIRPDPAREISLVRPRGTLWLHPAWQGGASAIAEAVVARGLRLGASRCGDFRAALALLASDGALATALAGLITHRLPAARLAEALRLARSEGAIKVVVEHPPAQNPPV